MGVKGLNFLRNDESIIGIKRFETIDAEPLFACKVRGNFIKTLFKSTPWLRISCNKEYKKKKKLRLALFLIPIIIIGVLTGGICASINEYKRGYNESFKESILSQDENEILIINSKNANNNNFSPCIEFYEGIRCDKSVIENLKKLMQAAKENGYNLKLEGGYISSNDLDKAYNEMTKNLMENQGYTQVRAEDSVQRKISNAKFSEHTTGLLLDIVPAQNTTDSDDYRWLIRNCSDYGFILRYPKNKESKTGREYNPYCFRYIGKENAKKIRSLSMCLEEYCRYLKLDYKY